MTTAVTRLFPVRNVHLMCEHGSMRLAIVLSSLLVPSVAFAHAVLSYPPPRTTELKEAPCGALNSTRGANVTTLAPGSTLTIDFKETIEHPGHYRISFDQDGQDFFMPTDYVTNTEGQLNVVDDMIPDLTTTPLPAGGRPYQVTITLPNVECTNCTIQLIQMMTENPPFDQNDVYFSCADITLAANAPDAGTNVGSGDDAGVDPGGGGPNSGVESGGCSAGGNGAGGLSALALLGLVGWRRRRR
jgi:uncharacterized protein (TIGR03382 family)